MVKLALQRSYRSNIAQIITTVWQLQNQTLISVPVDFDLKYRAFWNVVYQLQHMLKQRGAWGMYVSLILSLGLRGGLTDGCRRRWGSKQRGFFLVTPSIDNRRWQDIWHQIWHRYSINLKILPNFINKKFNFPSLYTKFLGSIDASAFHFWHHLWFVI